MTASYRLKLDRAGEHLEAVEDGIQRWLAVDRYVVIDEPDPDGGHHVVWIDPEEPPEALSMAVSDCVHNFRAALDNLAYAMALAYSGDPLHDKVARGSEFPIFGDRIMRPDEREQKIGGIDPTAQTIIENLQPYQRGNDYARDPLWVLHELDRIDKHRAIHLVLGSITGWSFVSPFKVSGAQIGSGPGPLEGKTQVMLYGSAEPLESGGKVNVNLSAETSISFPRASPANGELVLVSLDKIRGYIETEVVAPLEPFL